MGANKGFVSYNLTSIKGIHDGETHNIVCQSRALSAEDSLESETVAYNTKRSTLDGVYQWNIEKIKTAETFFHSDNTREDEYIFREVQVSYYNAKHVLVTRDGLGLTYVQYPAKVLEIEYGPQRLAFRAALDPSYKENFPFPWKVFGREFILQGTGQLDPYKQLALKNMLEYFATPLIDMPPILSTEHGAFTVTSSDRGSMNNIFYARVCPRTTGGEYTLDAREYPLFTPLNGINYLPKKDLVRFAYSNYKGANIRISFDGDLFFTMPIDHYSDDKTSVFTVPVPNEITGDGFLEFTQGQVPARPRPIRPNRPPIFIN